MQATAKKASKGRKFTGRVKGEGKDSKGVILNFAQAYIAKGAAIEPVAIEPVAIEPETESDYAPVETTLTHGFETQLFADLGLRGGTHRAAIARYFAAHLNEQSAISALGALAYVETDYKRTKEASVDYAVKKIEQRIVRNGLVSVYRVVRQGRGKMQTIGFYRLADGIAPPASAEVAAPTPAKVKAQAANPLADLKATIAAMQRAKAQAFA